MSDKFYQIEFRPDMEQVEQLREWMLAENKRPSALYHDISIITAYAQRYRLAVVIGNDKAIGFITWDVVKRVGKIVTTAVHPSYRRKGVGRVLAEAVVQHLLGEGVLVLYLECALAASEKFWRKMSFQSMPELDGYGESGNTVLYKPLIPVQKQNVTATTLLQLFEFDNTKTQSWPVEFLPGSCELTKPIIAPAGGDWRVQLIADGSIEEAKKVKIFYDGNCFDDPFLIVTRL